MANSSGWLQGIQYFRAIAIIEIIVFHIVELGVIVPNSPWITVALSAFTFFGPAHFIFISGVVLYNKYNNGFSLSAFYRRRFGAIVPPYLVWSTFYFAFYAVVLPMVFLQWNQSVVTLTSSYLVTLAEGFQHLWFVVLIIQLYFLYPLFAKMYNTTRQTSPIYILSFLLFVQIGYGLLITPGSVPSASLLRLLYASRFLFYAFYFVLGFFIAQHYEAMKRSVAELSLKGISLVVLVSTIYYAVVYYRAVLSSSVLPFYTWLNVLTGPFYCLLLILFYLRISTMWGEPRGFFLQYMEKIGEDSFGIYLIHWFAIWVFASVLFFLGLSAYNLVLYPVLFALTIISSYLAVEAIYHLPFSRIIIGTRRKKQVSPDRTSLTD